MARQFVEERLVLATHNAGKLAEIRELLRPHGVRVQSAGELGLPEPVEDGQTFEANARIKAEAAVRATGLPALADDSGVVVRGLDGAPGIYSARWAGPGGDFGIAMQRVHDELAVRFGGFEKADRAASFIACLCLAWPDGEMLFIEGKVSGELVYPPRGEGGFGFDPMFVPEDAGMTFAEMTREAKQALSHRARAMRLLLAACFQPGAGA
jgi:XTP/dITP diphosphohydrolase